MLGKALKVQQIKIPMNACKAGLIGVGEWLALRCQSDKNGSCPLDAEQRLIVAGDKAGQLATEEWPVVKCSTCPVLNYRHFDLPRSWFIVLPHDSH